MSESLVRRIAGFALIGSLVLAFPAVAGATTTELCSATGHSTGSAGVNITTATEWHLLSTDLAGGEGTSTVPMKTATVAAYAFGGLSIPIAGGTGDGKTAGSVDGVEVLTYARLGARFYVAGSASGDGGSCSGSIVIILDDVNALTTLLGGGGIALFVIALVVMIFGARSGGGCLWLLIDGLFGAAGGAGLALALTQFGLLDPTQVYGLAFPVVGAVAGFGTCGRMHRTPTPTA